MVLRKKLTVLLATVMLLGVMSVPVYSMTFVNPSIGELAKLGNNGNKDADGLDPNQGGGQERPKNERPPHAGGDKHGGGVELAMLGNSGHKAEDGLDNNQGGGQEKIKHEHPPHAGGDQHGGGSV